MRASRRHLPLILAIGFLLFQFAAPPATAGFRDAYDAYQRGDFRSAIRLFIPLAKQGDAIAQYHLGSMLAAGQGTPRNDEMAVRWLELAAHQDMVRAQHDLAKLLAGGRGRKADIETALGWYRRAATAGHGPSQIALGMIHRTGDVVPTDPNAAYFWFSLAARNDDNAVAATARAFREGVRRALSPSEVTRNEGRVSEWLARNRTRLTRQRPGGGDPRPDDEAATETSFSALGSLGRIGGGEALRLAESGTAIFVSPDGMIASNRHVVEGCTDIRGSVEGRRGRWTVKATSPDSDIAFLVPRPDNEIRPAHVAVFADHARPRAGEEVVVIGYPLSGLLADTPTVSTGIVANVNGLGSDARTMQITAPIQKGNSGGPVLDRTGRVIGIVSEKLKAVQILRLIGEVPQNVNFAVKAAEVTRFAREAGLELALSAPLQPQSTPDIVDVGAPFTLQIECWR